MSTARNKLKHISELFQFPSTKTAPVSGFAISFYPSYMIEGGVVTALMGDGSEVNLGENGLELKTNKKGQFGPFQWPAGKHLTLVFRKDGFKTTQTANFIVPPEGINGPNPWRNVSIQVPSKKVYYLMAASMNVSNELKKDKCQVCINVVDYQKTLNDIPQGFKGCTATIIPNPASTREHFHFGIWRNGIFQNKTNPLAHGLKKSTVDGGIAIINVTPGTYTVKITGPDGSSFNNVEFRAVAGRFVNITPPQSPMMQHDNGQEFDRVVEETKNNSSSVISILSML